MERRSPPEPIPLKNAFLHSMIFGIHLVLWQSLQVAGSTRHVPCLHEHILQSLKLVVRILKYLLQRAASIDLASLRNMGVFGIPWSAAWRPTRFDFGEMLQTWIPSCSSSSWGWPQSRNSSRTLMYGLIKTLANSDECTLTLHKSHYASSFILERAKLALSLR